MAAAVLLGLGAYRFSLDTAAYQAFVRDSDFGWKSMPRAANFPHYQNTTKGADAIELKGVIYPTFRGGLGQIEAMRATARTRVALPLVSGSGRWHGNWVIMKVGENSSVFLSNGAARKMEFTLSLEYAGS